MADVGNGKRGAPDSAPRPRDGGLALEVKGDPLLRRVRGDPRHAAHLARMGLPP